MRLNTTYYLVLIISVVLPVVVVVKLFL